MSYVGNTPFTAAFLTDTFSGNGSTVAFTMSVAPATTSSVIVAITGVLQDPSTYSVSGTTLTFSAAPPTGTSNISVRYLGIPASGVTTTAYRTQTEFTATAGQTTFSVPSYTVGFIDVYRNGLLLGSSDFTATNGTTVVLTNAASAGDFVETVSFYVSSVLNALPTTGGTLSGNLVVNGDETISGNVGIGTASPNSKLEVTSRITASDGGGASRIALNIESNTSAQTYSAINSYNYGTSTARNLVLNESGGNVGIGTSSPLTPLHVVGSIQSQRTGGVSQYARMVNSGGTATFISDNQASGTYTGFQFQGLSTASGTPTTYATIDGNGNVGIGTSSPNNKLVVSNGGAAGIEFGPVSGDIFTYNRSTLAYTDMVFTTNQMIFRTNGSNERMRIDSSGNLLVGATAVAMTNGGIQSQPNGNTTSVPFFGCAGNSSSNSYISHALYSTSLSQYQFYVGYGGTVYARSTSITGLSDQREKENIRTLDVGLNEVLALQPRRFDWKDGSTSNVAGFVAQEVETVLPDLVEEYRVNDDGETRFGLKMGDMIPVLVKVIQELKALVDTQASTITQLQADVAALKGTP